MLLNLQKALRDKNITIKAYASILGISVKTAENKIRERTDFTYPEVRKTMKEVLPEYNADYLYKSFADGESVQNGF